MTDELLGGSDCKKVFVDRNVWHLTPEYIATWKAQNETFFRYVQQYVPPGGNIAELGCGPGRHAITMALMGYRILAVDLDENVLEQASENAGRLTPTGAIRFRRGDLSRLADIPELTDSQLDAVTHGGLMEHFSSQEAVRETLRNQLDYAPYVIFDVPLGTPKNQRLFERDDVFRQEWTSEEWREVVLKDFNVVVWKDEIHDHASMTDDLVCVLAREPYGS